jgi:putative FmdB family regulatory protein
MAQAAVERIIGRGGGAMPVYEFFCRKCQKSFTAEMHVSEHDTGVAECPECHRKEDVEKRLSTFTAVTSRKSAGL